MFMSKYFIFCAFIAATQAGYGSKTSLYAGYAAQMQPAATISALPYGVKYNGRHGYAPAYGDNNGAYNGAYSHNLVSLTNLALSLPHAGPSIATTISHPNYPTSSYSAPIYDTGYRLPAYRSYARPATASTATAAASKVVSDKARTAYAPSYGTYRPS